MKASLLFVALASVLSFTGVGAATDTSGCEDSLGASAAGMAGSFGISNCETKLCNDPADTTGETPLKGDAFTTCVKEKCASDTLLCNFLAGTGGTKCCTKYKADLAQYGGYASMCDTCEVPANTPDMVTCYDAYTKASAEVKSALEAESYDSSKPGDVVCNGFFKTTGGAACCRFAGANPTYGGGDGNANTIAGCKACGVSTEGGVSASVDKAPTGTTPTTTTTTKATTTKATTTTTKTTTTTSNAAAPFTLAAGAAVLAAASLML